MKMFPFHPAPGLGFLTQGFHVVPQNPISGKREVLGRVPTLGELVSAAFVVPQNPLLKALSGCSCNGGCGGGCGCGNKNGVTGLPAVIGEPDGLGGFSDTSIDLDPGAILSGEAGWPTYVALAGGVFLLTSLFSRGSGYKEEAKGLRSKYRRRGSRLREAWAA